MEKLFTVIQQAIEFKNEKYGREINSGAIVPMARFTQSFSRSGSLNNLIASMLLKLNRFYRCPRTLYQPTKKS